MPTPRSFSGFAPALVCTSAGRRRPMLISVTNAPCINGVPDGHRYSAVFIRQIATGTFRCCGQGPILSQNIIGGLCVLAVCRDDNCGEQACVRESGRRARPGQDRASFNRLCHGPSASQGVASFKRAARRANGSRLWERVRQGFLVRTVRRMMGHDVTVFDARPKPGG